MKITFTELERQWVLTLPVTPSDYSWGVSRKKEVYEALYQDVDDIGNKNLKERTIESFAPDSGVLQGKKYPFQLTSSNGRNVIQAFENWIEQKTALRMVVTAKDGRTLENIIVKITELQLKLDRPGDYVYTMQLMEHVTDYNDVSS